MKKSKGKKIEERLNDKIEKTVVKHVKVIIKEISLVEKRLHSRVLSLIHI